ncbi:hypothetical protein L917_14908 [Phytophthora nicotianae]|uniref:Uncharacterized protein n=1 Tax=Phytophthora nicotianae TaxID=4792 RepID=W2KK56_PHYNI|nr:hypothetical protein L917_14908 [Phytophthora nicotianae]
MTLSGEGLLLKRVLSVEAFRQERFERSRGPPTHSQSKAIPMPLYPGESQQQYNHKFKQWLIKKHLRLESIQSDPKRERKLWLTFAFQRLNPSSTGGQRVQKRSIDEEYEAFYQRSASQSIKRLRRDRSMDSDRSANRGKPPARIEARREHYSTISSRDDEQMPCLSHTRPNDRRDEILSSSQMPPRSQRSISPASQSSTDKPFQPRSRAEILAPRVVSVDAYLREMKGPKLNRRSNGKLVKIPVPLFPGETMDDYEQEFGRWLHHRQTSVLSLRYKPLKERVYRHQFAYQRALKRTNSSKHPQLEARSQSTISKAKDNVHDANEPPGSRDEAKQHLSKSLPPKNLLLPKNPQEDKAVERTSHHSRARTNKADQAQCASRISDTNTPKVATQSPNTSSQRAVPVTQKTETKESKRQKEDAANAQHPTLDTSNEDTATIQLLKSNGAPDTLKSDGPSKEKLPSWASQLIGKVQKLEAKVTQLQRQVDSCPCCQGISSSATANPAPKLGSVEPSQESIAKNSTSLSNGTETKSKAFQAKSDMLNGSSAEILHDVSALSNENKNGDGKKENVVDKQPTCEEIYREATRILARAVQVRVHEDSKKRQLTEAYDHLNEQISMNETAIDDALDYIKAIKDVDEAIATEQHSQIMELVVSINKEKEKRASALAALIVYKFTATKDILVSLLEEEPSGEGRNKVNHDELRAISLQIEQKVSVLETLEMHLNEQLQWVTGLPPDVSEADKALRFKALRKMSKRLMKEQETKEQLEHKRNEVMKSFLQEDKGIRKLVEEELAKSRTVELRRTAEML